MIENINTNTSINQCIQGFKSQNSKYDTSDVIDEFKTYNEAFLPKDGEEDIIGTAIPYQWITYSDLITNPSSVSISEFQKMSYTMPVIKAGLSILNTLIINEIGAFHHENKKYVDYVDKMFAKMVRPFDAILRDILTGLPLGFAVLEKNYAEDLIDGKYIYIKDLEPRPAQSILFRVDSQGHLKEDGIIQYYFNNLWGGSGNFLSINQNINGVSTPNPFASRGDLDYPYRTVWAQPIGTVIIPVSKCVHFAYKGLDGLTSPYGRSILRDAYTYYLVAAKMPKILYSACNWNSSPNPVIVADPNQTQTADGRNFLEDVGIALSNANENGDGNPWITLEGKLNESVWLQELDNKANIDSIINTAKYFDSMMLTSVFFAGELAGLANKGSYALGKTQQDLQGRQVTAIADSVKSILISQFIKPLLQLNFDEEKDFGTFIVKNNVAEDIALNIDTITFLREQGIELTPEAIIDKVGFHMEMVKRTDAPIIGEESLDLAPNFRRTRSMNKEVAGKK